MVKKASRPSSGCPAEKTIAVVGGRWKVVIVWWLMLGKRRFSALQRDVPGVSQKMLTQQLRELEADGVVHREVYREVPPRVEYWLTPLGESLKPVLDAMIAWGGDQGGCATPGVVGGRKRRRAED